MAITDKDSVLILGAGVSAPFGLSLGGDMITDLSKAISREFQFLSGNYESRRGDRGLEIGQAMRVPSNFLNLPIHASIGKKHWNEEDNQFNAEEISEELKNLKRLGELLNDQTSETIDDFIVENPSYAKLTKIGIASLFILDCYKDDKSRLQLNPFSGRHFPPDTKSSERNWVHLLINIVRQGIRSESVSSSNKVKIITFNYDKILEHILDKQFTNTEANYPDYTDYIDIIHMHGVCGDLDDVIVENPADVCLKWAKGIHVIHEDDVPDAVKESRNSARQIVENARELYFCGFSFAGPNCRLLGLESPPGSASNRTFYFCNYDGNVGISRALEKYEYRIKTDTTKSLSKFETKIDEAKGTSEEPLGVVDWLRQGQIGELP